MTPDSRAVTDVWSLAIVIGTAAVIGVSNGMFTPLVSLKAETAGISPAWNGALAGAPAFAVLLLGLSFPPLIRRLDILWSFYLSTTVAVVGALLFPLFDNYWI